jgi:hypothetical protein
VSRIIGHLLVEGDGRGTPALGPPPSVVLGPVIRRYRATTLALGYEGDTVANSLGDVLSCAAGFALARLLGLR